VSAYLLLLCFASATSAACAGCIFVRDPHRPEGRLTSLLMLGAAFWASCEIAWNQAPDPDTAFLWMRTSAVGWIFIGVVSLHMVVELVGGATRFARLVVPAYLGSLACLILTWTTDWMLAEAVRTSWGWGYRVGSLYPAFYAMTIACVAGNWLLLPRLFEAGAWQGTRKQRPWVVVGMLVPVSVASFTDVILPILDVQVPRLGSTSFAVLGVLTVANVLRFGYSIIAPGTFSDEVLDSLGDGVALLHPDGRIRSVNDGLVQLTGRTREALVGSRLHDLLSLDLGHPPAELRGIEAEIRAAGAPVPVAVFTRLVRDRQGDGVGLVVVLRDLREIEALRSRLLTSGRMAAVGQLAAGIAHEINNPLAFVRANLGCLEGHWKQLRPQLDSAAIASGSREPLSEVAELIEESIEGVDRAAEIVRSVRSLSHAGTDARDRADLHAILDQVLRVASPQIGSGVLVERRYGAVPPLRCAPRQLEQAFLNLVMNAVQAVQGRGRVAVSTRCAGDRIVIDVEDDGCGIEPEIRDRIFDPFFTTKAAGEGTGLGLGIAYQIVRGHGGEIAVESQPGQGSRFRVELPLGGGVARQS
jgi:PAS domain S-box-containing protein